MVRKVQAEAGSDGKRDGHGLEPGLYLVGTVVARFKREITGRNGDVLPVVTYRVQAGSRLYEMSIIGDHEYLLIGTPVAERVMASVYQSRKGPGLRLSPETNESGF